MNPMTNMRNLNKMNEGEIKFSRVAGKSSWHNQYRESAWLFFAGMPYELTEGDIIVVFSQYGEVVNVNLIRDRKTGKSRGFGFICYENQMSTDLAVDNFNGTKVIGRLIRVDHVSNYKPPKDHDDADEISKLLREKGCYNIDISEIRNSNSSGGEKKNQEEKNRSFDSFDKYEETNVVRVKEEPKDDRPMRDERVEKEKHSKKKSKHRSRSSSESDRSRSRDRDHNSKSKHKKRSRS